MEVSARKPPFILLRKYSLYSRSRRVSMKGLAQNSPFSCYFEKKFITFTPGSYVQFLPRCLGQEIRVWPPSSVPYHRRFISLLQRSCRPRRFTRKQKHALNVYLSRIYIYLVAFSRFVYHVRALYIETDRLLCWLTCLSA